MRRARVDDNQAEVVAALRAMGATVLHTHTLGKGAPDIIVGFRGANLAFEIKDGSKPPARRKLTPDEAEWHATWAGHIEVVESADEAVNAALAATQGRGVPLGGQIR